MVVCTTENFLTCGLGFGMWGAVERMRVPGEICDGDECD